MLQRGGMIQINTCKDKRTWQGSDYTLSVSFESNLKVNNESLRHLDAGFFTFLLSLERGTRDETGVCSA